MRLHLQHRRGVSDRRHLFKDCRLILARQVIIAEVMLRGRSRAAARVLYFHHVCPDGLDQVQDVLFARHPYGHDQDQGR